MTTQTNFGLIYSSNHSIAYGHWLCLLCQLIVINSDTPHVVLQYTYIHTHMVCMWTQWHYLVTCHVADHLLLVLGATDDKGACIIIQYMWHHVHYIVSVCDIVIYTMLQNTYMGTCRQVNIIANLCSVGNVWTIPLTQCVPSTTFRCTFCPTV